MESITVAELIRPLVEPRKLNREEYFLLAESGAFENERVELIDGVIYPMTPASPYHHRAVAKLTNLFARCLSEDYEIGPQLDFAAADHTHVEPDVSVYRTGELTFDAHVSVAELVIEVARLSRRVDLGAKALVYALAKVPEYWVFDLDKRLFHRHTAPQDTGYQSVEAWPVDAPSTPSSVGFKTVTVPFDLIYRPLEDLDDTSSGEGQLDD